MHVSTDKPVYRLEEKLYWRSVVLDWSTHSLADHSSGIFQMEVVSPSGESVLQHSFSQVDHPFIVGCSFDIPGDWKGGEYKLLVTHKGCSVAERDFSIRAFRNPRIWIEIDFLREGYGPGDQVVAAVSAVRAEGGASAGASVKASVSLDGIQVEVGPLVLDQTGKGLIKFIIPEEIQEGEGTLTAVVQDGGVLESKGKSIPAVGPTKHLDVRVYPEGGYLVEGQLNTIYIETYDTNGEPIDVVGEIVPLDEGSKEDIQQIDAPTFVTKHEGNCCTL